MFSITPNYPLSLHTAGALYNVEWESQCGCNGKKTAHIAEGLVAQCDNHVKSWLQWKKEQEKKHKEHLRDLQRQDDWDAAFFRNEVREAQRVALETRREEA